MIFFNNAWGRASDRLGQRKIFLAAGLAVLPVIHALVAVAPSYEYLFLLNVLGAIAQAAYVTTSLALMGDLLEGRPDERGRRMGTYRGLGSLGFGLTAFLTGSVADRFSIRAPFALSALNLVVAFLLALRIKEPAPDGSPDRVMLRDWAVLGRLLLASARDAVKVMVEQFGALAKRLGNRERPPGSAPLVDKEAASERLPLTPLLLSAFLWSLAFGAVFAVWPNYMVSELGYSQADVGRLWSLAAISELPLMILSGWLSDRVGRLPMLCVGFLAWVVVFVGYVVAPMMPWIVFIQLVRGFAYSAFTATAMTYTAEARPRSQRGWVSGLYGSAGGIGSIIGASMGGTLSQLAGFRAMISTNAVLIFGGTVYLVVAAVRWRVGKRSSH
jgi:MFS family permease